MISYREIYRDFLAVKIDGLTEYTIDIKAVQGRINLVKFWLKDGVNQADIYSIKVLEQPSSASRTAIAQVEEYRTALEQQGYECRCKIHFILPKEKKQWNLAKRNVESRVSEFPSIEWEYVERRPIPGTCSIAGIELLASEESASLKQQVTDLVKKAWSCIDVTLHIEESNRLLLLELINSYLGKTFQIQVQNLKAEYLGQGIILVASGQGREFHFSLERLIEVIDAWIKDIHYRWLSTPHLVMSGG